MSTNASKLISDEDILARLQGMHGITPERADRIRRYCQEELTRANPGGLPGAIGGQGGGIAMFVQFIFALLSGKNLSELDMKNLEASFGNYTDAANIQVAQGQLNAAMHRVFDRMSQDPEQEVRLLSSRVTGIRAMTGAYTQLSLQSEIDAAGLGTADENNSIVGLALQRLHKSGVSNMQETNGPDGASITPTLAAPANDKAPA